MKRFKNILFVSEEPEIICPAFKRAVSLACDNHARLTITDIIPIPNKIYLLKNLLQGREPHDAIIDERRRKIEAILPELPRELDITVKVSIGKPFLEITKAVLRYGYDLIIKSPDTRKNIGASLFGSTDMHLLRKCPCPVWIVASEKDTKIRKILAAVDLESYGDDDELNALNQQILEMSTSLAWNETSQLHIVHAWMVMGDDMLDSRWHKYIESDVQEWITLQKEEVQIKKNEFSSMLYTILHDNDMEALDVRIHMMEGDPEEVIPREVKEKEIDLVVMGTISRTDLAGFFIGSTAETILSRVNRSVLAVKPLGFVSPVTLDE